MRITRKTLVNLAEQAVLKRTQGGHDIEAVYLIGAVAHRQEPLLGGAADIDLVFIHRSQPPQPVERVALSADIHLDILHRHTSAYEPLRALRENPSLGPELYAPQVLFKTGFFLERAQAALLADYHAPRYALARARQLMDAARQDWFDLQTAPQPIGPPQIWRYLQAVEKAANAIVALDGQPLLSTRRFLSDFAARTQALKRTDRQSALLGLLGNLPDKAQMQAWLPDWETAFQAAVLRGTPGPALHAARQTYYLKGIQANLQSDRPYTALWPLLYTWTQAVLGLEDDLPLRQKWAAALQPLEILDEAFAHRLALLDAFLDEIDLHLEQTAAQNGLE